MSRQLKLLKMRRQAFANLTKKLLKKFLIRLGVKSIPAGIAAHFIFKYIFQPIAKHLMRKRVLRTYTTVDGVTYGHEDSEQI